jgi:hypothetical protein
MPESVGPACWLPSSGLAAGASRALFPAHGALIVNSAYDRGYWGVMFVGRSFL